ncbi:MAG: hypothetical protein ACK4NF_04835, partial [Planctomycetota bacterium]
KRHVMGEEPTAPQTSEEHLLLPWSYIDPQNIEDFYPSKPLENNLNVSLKKYEVNIEGTGKVGLSEVLNQSQNYIEGFSLKVIDVHSQIFINGYEERPSRDENIHPLAPNVIKMLNSLGDILKEKYNFSVDNLGQKINNLRLELGRNIISKDELLPILGKTLKEQTNNLNILEGFITVYAEPEHKAINPNVFYRDNQSFDITLRESKNIFLKVAPININTASFEVLYSVFNGLRGYQWSATKYNFIEVKIDSSTAKKIAEDLVKYRTDKVKKTYTGLTIFDDIERFLNTLPYLSYEQKKLILANASSNSRLNIYNPNKVMRNLFGDVDRAKLIYSSEPAECGFTTPFIFDSNGLYEISSLGRVLKIESARGDIIDTKTVAQKLVKFIIRLYKVKKITTENDFHNAIISSNNIKIYPEPTDISELDGYFGIKLFEWEPLEKSFKFYQNQKDADFSLSDERNLGNLSEKPKDCLSIGATPFKGWIEDGVLFRKKLYTTSKFVRQIEYTTKFNLDKSMDLNEGAVAFWIKPAWRVEELKKSPKVILTINRKGIPYLAGIAIEENGTYKLIFINFQIAFKNEIETKRVGLLFKVNGTCESLYKNIESQIKQENINIEMKRNYTGVWEYDISDWQPGEWHHIAVGWAPDKITNVSLLPNVPFEGVQHCPENLVYWEDFKFDVEQSEIPVTTFFVDGSSARATTQRGRAIRLTIFSNLLMPFLQKVEEKEEHDTPQFDFMPMFSNDYDIYIESGVTLKDVIVTKKFDSLFLRPQRDDSLEKEVIECVKKMRTILLELTDMSNRIAQIAEILRSMGGSGISLSDLAQQYQRDYFGGATSEFTRLMQEAVELSNKILERLNSACPKEILDKMEEIKRQMEQSTVTNAKLLVPMIRYHPYGELILGFDFDEDTLPFSLEWTHYVPNYWKECVYYHNEKIGCFKGPSFIGIRDRMHTGGMEFLQPAKPVKGGDKIHIKFEFSTNQKNTIFESPFVDDIKIKALYLDTTYKIIQSSDIRNM